MKRLLEATTLLLLLTPFFSHAGKNEGSGIPRTTCDAQMVETIYKEERGELMDMIQVHFVDGDKSVSDDEFCRQLEAKFDGETESKTCATCQTDVVEEDPEEFKRSSLDRRSTSTIISHVDRPVTTQSNNSGGFFSNSSFWGGALVGGLIGGIGGYMLGNMMNSGNNQQQMYPPGPNYPPPYNPYGPYGRPPFQPPYIAGPVRPPWMMQQPGMPFQYPYSGGMNNQFPGMPGYMPGGYNMGMNYPGLGGQMYQPGGYYPYQGNSYYGQLPSYYYTGGMGGYPYGSGYNPYAPAILPMPQATR
jgi:hypothetical protein